MLEKFVPFIEGKIGFPPLYLFSNTHFGYCPECIRIANVCQVPSVRQTAVEQFGHLVPVSATSGLRLPRQTGLLPYGIIASDERSPQPTHWLLFWGFRLTARTAILKIDDASSILAAPNLYRRVLHVGAGLGLKILRTSPALRFNSVALRTL